MNSPAIIKQRRDTAANWAAGTAQPLYDGQLGIEVTKDGQNKLTSAKVKVGDGISTWSELPYISVAALSDATNSTQSGYFGDIYLWDDSTPSHYLRITNSANLTAARTFSLNVNDADRTVSLGGNLTLANSFTTIGNFSLSFTTSAATALTLPASGTVATTSNKISDFAACTSSELSGKVSDETGSGFLVFATSPTFTTSVLTSNTGAFNVFNTNATTINAFGAATAISIGAGTGTTTINNNLAITGNLTINGTTTTVNSTTVTIDDPIFTLGGDTAPATDDNKDRGIEFRWRDGGGAKVGFFGFDDSAGVFTFIPNATNTSEVFTGTAGNVAFGGIAGTTGTFSSTISASNFSGSSSGTNTGNQTIQLTGDVTGTGTGTFAATIANSAVTLAKIQNLAATTVIGNATASAAVPTAIAAGTDGHVLRRSSTTLGFGTIATAGIADDAVTYAKIQNVTASRLLGRSTASAGDIQEISLAGGLAFSGSNLTFSAGATTQVMFNDGGTLAGDAGLTYNKTTDKLSVTGGLVTDSIETSTTFALSSASNVVGVFNVFTAMPSGGAGVINFGNSTHNNATVIVNGVINSGAITATSLNLTGSSPLNSGAGFTIGSGAITSNSNNTNYSLQASDNGKILTFNNSSPINVTVSYALGVGFTCTIIALGTGKITIVPASSPATTLNWYGGTGSVAIAGQHGAATLVAYVAETYNVSGTLQ
jgi:hypothetical protein